MSEEPNLPDEQKPRTRPLPRQKTPEEIEALIDAQGVRETATFEHQVGAGADWWESDEECEEFVRGIHERRKQGQATPPAANGSPECDARKDGSSMSEEPNLPPEEKPRTRLLPRQYTPEEVAAILAKQGPKPRSNYEGLIGAGAGLWDSDEDLDEFLRGIYERRKQG